ncbi:MAG: hypothetical protein RIQ89_533 [Bacteroidota bacterium]
MLSLGISSTAAPFNSIASGAWSNPAIWDQGSVPVAGSDVFITLGHTVTVSVNTALVANLSVNGTLDITNTASSSLTMDGNIIINGSLLNNGNFDVIDGGTWALNAGATYYHNPRANILNDESPFFNTLETFAPTSNLIIKKWNDNSVPLCDATRVNGNVGNVTMEDSFAFNWDQDGRFAPNKIKGKLTVTNVPITMDDGTGATTSLALNDVEINGTGSIIFASGPNRALTLTTGNFIENTTAASPPVIAMNNTFGTLIWTVTGNMTVRSDLRLIEGTGIETGGIARLTVTGNLDLIDGKTEMVTKADAPCTLTVNGNTTLHASLDKFRIVDGNTGLVSFTTNNLNINGCNDITFLGGGLITTPEATGNNTITVTQDLTIAGGSIISLTKAPNNLNATRLIVGRDFIMSAATAQLQGFNGVGIFSLRVDRNLSITAGSLIGQMNPLAATACSLYVGVDFVYNNPNVTNYFIFNQSAGNTVVQVLGSMSILNTGTTWGDSFTLSNRGAGSLSVSVGGNFTLSNGNFSGNFRGTGSTAITISGAYQQSGGIFRLTNNDSSLIGVRTNFTANSINFTGGRAKICYGVNTDNAPNLFTVTNNASITFAAATDTFAYSAIRIIGAQVNNGGLTTSIGGTLTIGGANGVFSTTIGTNQGIETINVNTLTVNNGLVSFNGYKNFPALSGRNVYLTCTNINVNGGELTLTALNADDNVITVNGNISVTAGQLNFSAANDALIVNIFGSFTQSGGNTYIHNNTSVGGQYAATVNFNVDDNATGDFSMTGGTLVVDNYTGGTAPNHKLIFKTPNITYGAGTGIFRPSGTSSIFTEVEYSRTGTINYNEIGAFTNQWSKQTVFANCTLNVVNNIQVSSFPLVGPNYFFFINSNAVVDMNTGQMYANTGGTSTGLLMSSDSRLFTARPQGFYNGAGTACLNSTNPLYFLLASTSIVEYDGTATQIVTGIGQGLATGSAQKYGILRINHNGLPANYCYPDRFGANDSVFVRTRLELVQGELNLDDDRNPANGGGRGIIIESGAITAINRTSGYIRSEEYGGNGLVKWKMNTTTGAHIIPFGYDAATYIPFTFTFTGGNAGTVMVGTYRSSATNLPYPPTVTHVRDNAFVDNSGNTADRFWYIAANGGATPPLGVDVTFIAAPVELTGIVNPRAQRWVAALYSWQAPLGVQSTLANGTQANAIPFLFNWWTLSSQANPLPVDLLYVKASCQNKKGLIEWATASEINNEKFIIEKSIDANKWEEIGVVSGAGNSNQTIVYHFMDNDVAFTNSYYRLKQVDFDGMIEISNPVALRACTALDGLQIISYQTDQSSSIRHQITNAGTGDYTLQIMDAKGKMVVNQSVSLGLGDQQIETGGTSLSAGIYIVRLFGNDQIANCKLLVK